MQTKTIASLLSILLSWHSFAITMQCKEQQIDVQAALQEAMNSVCVNDPLLKDFKQAVQKGCAQDSVNIHDFIRLFYLGQMVLKYGSISFDLNPVHSKMKCFNSSVFTHYEYIFEDLWTIPFTLSNQALEKRILSGYMRLQMANGYQQYCRFILEELERQELAHHNNIKYKRALIGCGAAAFVIGGGLLIKHSDSLCAMLQKWQENSYSFVSVQSWLKESKIGKFFGQDSVTKEQIKALLELEKRYDALKVLLEKRIDVFTLNQMKNVQKQLLENAQNAPVKIRAEKKAQEKANLRRLETQLRKAKNKLYKIVNDYKKIYPDDIKNPESFIKSAIDSNSKDWVFKEVPHNLIPFIILDGEIIIKN